MNIYGDVVTNQESEAHGKIVGLALPRAYWRYGSQLSQVVENMAERVGLNASTFIFLLLQIVCATM